MSTLMNWMVNSVGSRKGVMAKMGMEELLWTLLIRLLIALCTRLITWLSTEDGVVKPLAV